MLPQGSLRKEFPVNIGGSDVCFFCRKRVYVMERLSAEGKFFHRSCFKCDYCGTTLRLSSYAFDVEDGESLRSSVARSSKLLQSSVQRESLPAQEAAANSSAALFLSPPGGEELLNAGRSDISRRDASVIELQVNHRENWAGEVFCRCRSDRLSIVQVVLFTPAAG